MFQLTTAGRSGIAAAGLFTALLLASACGTQTAADLEAPGIGSHPTQGGQGQSAKAIDADARRAAQGQLPSPAPAAPGKRLPDARP